MSTPTFRETIKNFVSAGIKPKFLVPVAPTNATIDKNSSLKEENLGKAPGRYQAKTDDWAGLFKSGDNKVITDGISKREYERDMQHWPTPNAGVLGRAYPGIDSDAENDDARRLIEDVLDEVFGRNAAIAERLRGKGPRRLYALKCVNPDHPDFWVRTRHLTYTLSGATHKLDIIGYGNHYVITGIHPSGDRYGWREGHGLADLAPELVEVDNSDIERFLEVFQERLEEDGGELVTSSGGGAPGDEYDTTELEPNMSVEAALEGLDRIPNTEANFPYRDSLVSILSSIRAALGKDACQPDVEEDIREWATKDPVWCWDDYFDKIWQSTKAVRVERNSLDRVFRRNGITTHVKDIFKDDTAAYSKDIKKVKEKRSSDRDDLLATVASQYIFGEVNLREGNGEYTMRNVWNVDREWSVLKWWKYKLPESDHAILGGLKDAGYAVGDEVGMANFLRDLRSKHPNIFYSGETRHPNYDKGEIYKDVQPDGSHKNLVNMRYISQVIRLGNKDDKNAKRSAEDVRHILEFGNLLFGTMFDYELDTMAFMAQTGRRPGSMLFLVGDSGVGKSIWINLQAYMFDGVGPGGSAIIDGAKLLNESARRFVFGRIEGCRIVSIKELPDGRAAKDMALITSQLKQIVDPGSEGDYITVEAKGVDPRPIRNFCRVLISSNYANAVQIEQYDRRIFYVKSGITIENKPDDDFYGRLVDILNDPERMAAFWRYLRQRDISKYSPFAPPPTSIAKAERIVAEIENPAIRHAYAAMAWLKASNRKCFDAEEFAELMTECATAEYVNSSGAVDCRRTYRLGEGKADPILMTAMKTISRHDAVKMPRELRTAKKRFPAVYVMAKHLDLLKKFMAMSREEILEFVNQEYDMGLAPHPMPMFRQEEKDPGN